MANHLHEKVFAFLESYRVTHPHFKYWLREKNNRNRLQEGYWFQGSHYAFVGLYNRGGGSNMTRSFGLVFYETGEGNIGCKLEIVFNEEPDQKIIDFYFAAMDLVGGFKQERKTKFFRILSQTAGFEAAKEFLNNEKSKIDALIENLGLGRLFITEEEFQEKLTRVLSFRDSAKSKAVSANAHEKFNTADLVMKLPLNTILHGPPGTGKTYNTVNKAIEIVDPKFYEKNRNNRTELLRRFEQLLIKDWSKPAGQIAFITFHQSMSYEDFIEGIKPVKPEIASGIQYEIQNGIFKNICAEASRISKYSITLDGVQRSLTRELFEEFYISFSQNLPIQSETSSSISLKTKEGYPFDLFKNGAGSIVVKSGEKRTPLSVSLTELLAVLFENKEPAYKSYEQIIIDKILEGKGLQKGVINNSKKKFVLIIDEINRGNVSQIFGELITLIEEDKRTDGNEALEVVLPYSKKPFAVPSNVFIIGTMNTADRSVEALDTALRRRFLFEEMPPKLELLSPKCCLWRFLWDHCNVDWEDEEFKRKEDRTYPFLGLDESFEKQKEQIWEEMAEVDDEAGIRLLESIKFKGLNLDALLQSINYRLEALLSIDHKIGHAWLMDVYDLDGLKFAFKTKILPLLQEYFYNNYAKIGLVLGDAFVKQTTITKGLFAKFEDGNEIVDDIDGKVIYSLVDPFKLNLADFRSIYQ
jgi:5-methylcytosine-specific restriction endonuclease McrBC GTP-binding regulatory subunit McrB